MAELGQTADPRQLVPGDASAVAATATALRERADVLRRAGSGLGRIDTADGWTGPAAEAFRARFHGQPGAWLQAADCFDYADGGVQIVGKADKGNESTVIRRLMQIYGR